ncbi:MAG TPA: alpha/beta hydrolase [Gemmatimonadaceae bacterium]|nr:alpha/beta hydrolase [Gemmatimonadaceae bacterium]
MILPGLTTVVRGAMLVFGLAAIFPLSTGEPRSHADPAHDYADAVARADAIIALDARVAAPGGSSILETHGARTPRAIVLLHGFTDSPRQFAALADSLYAEGDNVFVPRLPHHAMRGKDVSELAKLTAQELCDTGDEAVDIAAGLGDTVVVLGLSAGATVAAFVAEHRPEVQRAVMIAPAFEFTHAPSMLERSIVNISEHVPNFTRRAAPEPGRPDRDPGFATHGLAQVLRLGMTVRRDAERLLPPSAEMLFLVNAHDHTVKTAPVLDLAARWNRHGTPVSVYEFPDSLRLPHNIVDPIQRPTNGVAVYPVLEALAHGDRVPTWVRRR